LSLRSCACALAAIAASGCAAGTEEVPRTSAGSQAFAKCQSCHSLGPGENLPSGPTLHEVVGRPVAAEPGFDYSPALRRFASTNPRWTPALLDRFVTDPEAMVPGTYMAFHGISDHAERTALIEWLGRR
jgi:cytochrome c